MYLSDVDIAKALDSRELKIESMDQARYPFSRTQIRYSSVDLRVGNSFMRYKTDIKALDVVEDAERIENFFQRLPPLKPGGKIVLNPGEVLFATTLERLTLSNGLAARIVPRTTIARFGVSVTCSNDFVNPGQNGTLSLQLVNHNPFPIFIAPYISICQLIIVKLFSPASKGYQDEIGRKVRYGDEIATLPPRMDLDAEVIRILDNSGVKSDDPWIQKSVADVLAKQNSDLALYIRHQMSQSKSGDSPVVAKIIRGYTNTGTMAVSRLRTAHRLACALTLGICLWVMTTGTYVVRGGDFKGLIAPVVAMILSGVFAFVTRKPRQ